MIAIHALSDTKSLHARGVQTATLQAKCEYQLCATLFYDVTLLVLASAFSHHV